MTTFDKLIYQFHDAAVPPKFHRSYTIEASPGKLAKRIHSYGNTISLAEKALSLEDFDSIQRTFKQANISKDQFYDTKNCVGGKGITISTFLNDQEIFSAKRFLCAGETTGDLQGDTDILLTLLNDFLSE